jgi:anti-sigma factor RsiW
MHDEELEQLLSGYLDTELTQQQRQRVEVLLESSPEHRARLEELTRLREGIAGLRTPEPTPEQWSRMMSSLTRKTSRGLGWIFGIAGAVILAGFAIWQFSVDETVPALIKIAVLAVILGVWFLFVSVLLDRLEARKTDRYKDVEL